MKGTARCAFFSAMSLKHLVRQNSGGQAFLVLQHGQSAFES